MTTGDGKTKPAEDKPCVFQRDVNKSYQLKMKAARTAYNEINAKHSVFPFASRQVIFSSFLESYVYIRILKDLDK